MGASSDSEYFTALASESEHATTSSAPSFPARAGSISSETKEEIERPKVDWSQLTDYSDFDDDEVAKVSNVKVFKSLQMHPSHGDFFRTFGDGGIYDCGELEVGEKFAEGGQAEIFHAHVTWKNPARNLSDQKDRTKWVLKVFRKGTFLRQLQKQWPKGMFRHYEERIECAQRRVYGMKYSCDIICRTLLPDGRFAFLVLRETGDLRTLIDCQMKARACLDCGPFPKDQVPAVMYLVAQGMNWLHNFNIVHRDLKASNVFCSRLTDHNGEDGICIYVGDFECSIGVVGTGFFRAPEILQALRDKVVNKSPNVFTKAADVYSYGMVCYEILTGKLPFEGHLPNDYDLVLKRKRLEVCHHVGKWVCDLLSRCWETDPAARPTSREIWTLLEANSTRCKKISEKNRRYAREDDKKCVKWMDSFE